MQDWPAKRHESAEHEMSSRESENKSLVRIRATKHHRPVPAVYLLEAIGSRFIKIGTVRSVSNLDRRQGELQMGCPYELRRVLVLSEHGRATESRLHKVFAKHHFRGEWFNCDGGLKEIVQWSYVDEDKARRMLRRFLGS